MMYQCRGRFCMPYKHQHIIKRWKARLTNLAVVNIANQPHFAPIYILKNAFVVEDWQGVPS